MFNLGEHIREYVESKGINLSVVQLSKLDDQVYNVLSETGLDEIIDEAMKDMMEVDEIIHKDEPEVEDRVQVVSSDAMLKTGVIVSIERHYSPFDPEKNEFMPYPYQSLKWTSWGFTEAMLARTAEHNLPSRIEGDMAYVEHPISGTLTYKEDGYAYNIQIDGVEEPIQFLREHFNVLKG